MRGFVRLSVFSPSSPPLRFSSANMVLTLGREQMARVWAGNGLAAPPAKIGFGRSASPSAPDMPGLTDALILPFRAATEDFGAGPILVSPGDILGFNALFPFSIAPEEGNGLPISEVGLLTADNRLLVRWLPDATITKTPDIRIAGAWAVEF